MSTHRGTHPLPCRGVNPIARLRRELGWTQATAARALGVCVRAVQRMEAGPLSWPEAEVAARVYGAALGRQINPQYELYGLPQPHLAHGRRAGLSTR